jgi:hypothetical protein
MVVNFRVRKINRGARKLVWTFILIIKKYFAIDTFIINILF